MSSSSENTPTRRMPGNGMSSVNVPQPVTPPDEATRRMDLRPPANLAQSDIATRRTSGEQSGTQPTAAETSTAAPLRVRPLGFLNAGTILCGDYAVVATHHNHESERPGLFECRASQGRVMVKIAATEHPPQLDLWHHLPKLNHPNIIRTHRVLEAEGHFFEVQEFCAAGTLADLVPYPGLNRPSPPPEWVERVLVPAFHAGISYLHHQGIVHRDIKPSNLYLREENGRKTLVIGDFDISSVLQTGRTSRSTQRAAGTWNYSPPEAFPRFVDPEGARGGAAVLRSSDYYSFGVVLVELLVGTTSLHQAQLPDLYDFYLQGGRVAIPEGLTPRLRELLGGLLCRNRHRRWGGEEVARWLNHTTTAEDRKRIAEDGGFQLSPGAPAFTAFETIKPTTLAQLNEAIIREPVIALDELMSGDVLLNWIGQLDAGIARNIRRDREQWRATPRLALLCARLRLDPSAPLPIGGGLLADSAEDWAKKAQVAVGRHQLAPEILCSEASLQELESWLSLKASSETDAAKRVAQIRAFHRNQGVAPPNNTPPQSAAQARLILEELAYAFLPQKPFLIAPNLMAQSPHEIPALAWGESSEWTDKPSTNYRHALKRWQDGALEAYLRQRLTDGINTDSPLLRQIHKARLDFPNKPIYAFETILRLLAPQWPAIQIEFDLSALEKVLEVPYGQDKTYAVSYRAHGAGMPLAAVQIRAQGDALQLETHEIVQRQGQIVLHLFSHTNTPVAREYQATITLAGAATQLSGEPLVARYRITYPRASSFKKIAISALLGGALVGGTRLALMPIVSQSLRMEHAALLSWNTWGILLGVFLLAMSATTALWLWALGHHRRE